MYALSDRFICSCWCVNGDFERKWTNLCQWQITGKGHNTFPSVREERLHTFTTFNLKSSCCWVQPCSNWKPIPVRLSLQVQENNSHKQTGIQQLTSITMTNLTLNISCSDPIHFQMNSTHFHFTLYFYCALHTPKDTYILLMYPIYFKCTWISITNNNNNNNVK